MTYTLTKSDRNLFRGNAAGVHGDMDTTSMLDSVNGNFEVINESCHGSDGRAYPDHRLWLRSDNRDALGQFGSQRVPQQPTNVVQHYKDFCASSEKAITLDVIGTIDGGKVFYMASKLHGNNAALLDQDTYGDGGGLAISRRGSSEYIASEDRTDHWLMLMTHYGKALATTATVMSLELVCSNGMTRRHIDQKLSLSNRMMQDSIRVGDILNRALRNARAYEQMKNRFVETPLTIAEGVNAIRHFHGDPEGQTRTVKTLERIYRHELIGGELDTRQDNVWRLLNAHTQHTSHSRVCRSDGGKTLLSQVEGAKAQSNRRFLDFLESQFAPDLSAQLALV